MFLRTQRGGRCVPGWDHEDGLLRQSTSTVAAVFDTFRWKQPSPVEEKCRLGRDPFGGPVVSRATGAPSLEVIVLPTAPATKWWVPSSAE